MSGDGLVSQCLDSEVCSCWILNRRELGICKGLFILLFAWVFLNNSIMHLSLLRGLYAPKKKLLTTSVLWVETQLMPVSAEVYHRYLKTIKHFRKEHWGKDIFYSFTLVSSFVREKSRGQNMEMNWNITYISIL